MIRIVIAEDQELLLQAMGSLLNLEDDMEVVGLAANGEEALTLIHQFQPDVCLMDIEMPKMTGLEAAEALISSFSKIIILTTFARPGYFRRALEADVRAYLLKDSPSEELASAIRCIMDGKRIYSPELMDVESSATEVDGENESSDQRDKSIGIVRSYLSTILDKIKLPTG
ncbi:response regulator transcription factor [Neobacillus sp. MM2021_6]|uniref:response regulator n=1 Tax=Bacillaceae TaxID=186817 RepID=UPI00140B6160|nr:MULTISPECIES: response regulator transcription factor [Bacillaceae]MBO0962237.1 response regulator transcription factor [Neobacillus sp. MM2021_6]NHC18250.1 response regulator transcription factor [Bacillus sp. MM2020_4]